MHLFTQWKQRLKLIAKEIIADKEARSGSTTTSLSALHSRLAFNRRKYRHLHIAYCICRGRSMKEVENTTRKNNKPNMEVVNSYRREYAQWLVDNPYKPKKEVTVGKLDKQQDVCSCSEGLTEVPADCASVPCCGCLLNES